MGMSLAYRVVTRDSPVGHEVSKPGWFSYLFYVDFTSLHLSYTLGAGGSGRGKGRKAKKPFSGHLCKLLCGPLCGLLLKSTCSHCANRYVPPLCPLGRQGGDPGCLMSLNVSWCLRRYFMGLEEFRRRRIIGSKAMGIFKLLDTDVNKVQLIFTRVAPPTPTSCAMRAICRHLHQSFFFFFHQSF